MPIPLKVIPTNDSSKTIYNAKLKETYHSINGAVTESIHVYINAGLKYFYNKNTGNKIKILEIGLGTGLNVILSVQKIMQLKNTLIHFTSLEPFPLSKNIIKQLNYLSFIEKKLIPIFEKIHSSSFENNIELLENFIFQKTMKKIEDFSTKEKYDIIFFDAFAPSKQPEIWKIENLKKLYKLMKSKSILVTYCASGQFKRTLKKVGFDVEVLEGPPGKKEIVRASK